MKSLNTEQRQCWAPRRKNGSILERCPCAAQPGKWLCGKHSCSGVRPMWLGFCCAFDGGMCTNPRIPGIDVCEKHLWLERLGTYIERVNGPPKHPSPLLIKYQAARTCQDIRRIADSLQQAMLPLPWIPNQTNQYLQSLEPDQRNRVSEQIARQFALYNCKAKVVQRVLEQKNRWWGDTDDDIIDMLNVITSSKSGQAKVCLEFLQMSKDLSDCILHIVSDLAKKPELFKCLIPTIKKPHCFINMCNVADETLLNRLALVAVDQDRSNFQKWCGVVREINPNIMLSLAFLFGKTWLTECDYMILAEIRTFSLSLQWQFIRMIPMWHIGRYSEEYCFIIDFLQHWIEYCKSMSIDPLDEICLSTWSNKDSLVNLVHIAADPHYIQFGTRFFDALSDDLLQRAINHPMNRVCPLQILIRRHNASMMKSIFKRIPAADVELLITEQKCATRETLLTNAIRRKNFPAVQLCLSFISDQTFSDCKTTMGSDQMSYLCIALTTKDKKIIDVMFDRVMMLSTELFQHVFCKLSGRLKRLWGSYLCREFPRAIDILNKYTNTPQLQHEIIAWMMQSSSRWRERSAEYASWLVSQDPKTLLKQHNMRWMYELYYTIIDDSVFETLLRLDRNQPRKNGKQSWLLCLLSPDMSDILQEIITHENNKSAMKKILLEMSELFPKYFTYMRDSKLTIQHESYIVINYGYGNLYNLVKTRFHWKMIRRFFVCGNREQMFETEYAFQKLIGVMFRSSPTTSDSTIKTLRRSVSDPTVLLIARYCWMCRLPVRTWLLG